MCTPDDVTAAIEPLAPLLTYGWGVLPATVTIGATTFGTSLIPKDGGYLVPVKKAVRTSEQLELGDQVTMRITFML